MSYSRLSDDLVFNVLDYLDFHGVFVYSHVSSHCRSVARNHPTYWKTLRLTDRVTKGELALFLDRLATRRSVHATLKLTLTWITSRNDVLHLVLPALHAHLHRVAVLTFMISSNAPPQLWDLFKLSTPQLRRLKVLVTGQGLTARPLPSMFDVHLHQTLESVALVDAVLPPNLAPLSHAIKDITVSSTVRPLDLRRILDWAPRTNALGLWRLNICSQSPFADQQQELYATTATHICLNGNGWLPVLHSLAVPDTLPSLTIRASLPSPADVTSVLPKAARLCVCVKEERSPGSGAGIVAVTTVSRDVLRVFEGVWLPHMLSDAFMGHFAPHFMIETLVISLNLGFSEMCRRRYSLPHLRTLCLGMTRLPEAPDAWTLGSIACPELQTLAFQQEYEQHEASVSQGAIRSFVLEALNREMDTKLHIVLKAVRLKGGEAEKGIGCGIEYKPPRAQWLQGRTLNFNSRTRMSMSWLEI